MLPSYLIIRTSTSNDKAVLGLYRGFFAKRYPPGLNEQEAEKPLWAYPSLNALFTRGVKPECRPIPTGTSQFLAPCLAGGREAKTPVAGHGVERIAEALRLTEWHVELVESDVLIHGWRTI